MEDLVMGSIRARITVISKKMSAEQAESAMRSAFDEVHRVDRLMSKYKEDSDVSRLNGSGAGTWVEIDPATFQVIAESQRIAQLTRGAFDITALPLSTVWGFWPEREPRVPPDDEIQEALSHIGFGKLSLVPSSRRVTKTDAATQVDLGGIAKGYAVDKAMEVLRAKGVRDALVEIGGEARALGKNKEGKPWRIGVMHPLRQGFLTILPISDKSVATSGDYMKFFVVEDKAYSHLIDPRTGRPIFNNLCSVTVLADNCTEADALATAVSILGSKEGLRLIESLPGVECILVERKGDGKGIEVLVSSGLKGMELTTGPETPG
jgi:thiamine biosynthesis lipoprotein